MQLVTAQDNTKVGKTVMAVVEASSSQYILPVIPKDDSSDEEMDINVSMIPREEGEVSYICVHINKC